jgi:uncharacterized protein (UPF0332 family)
VSERSPEAQNWVAALRFLAEAEQLLPTAVPHAAIHSAYYAMFHAARAVLVKIDGASAPAKHKPVVNRFGFHAKQANDAALKEAGRLLSISLQRRLQSDYDTQREMSPQDAETAIEEARRFLETCARVHGFPPP